MGCRRNEFVGDRLNNWVHKKLRDTGWSMRELGRRAGLSSSYLSGVLSGKMNPGLKFYRGISEAFDVTIDALDRLDQEGIDPETQAGELLVDQISELCQSLPRAGQLKVLDYVLHLRQRQEEYLTGGGDDLSNEEERRLREALKRMTPEERAAAIDFVQKQSQK